MTKSILALIASILAAAGSFGQGDPFASVKTAMSRAACCRYEFLSIVESSVFETVDTTRGTALIAADGRYHILIGTDEYLRTSERLYSYSRTENQLTVEAIVPGNGPQESVSFVTRFDAFYSTKMRTPRRQYFLKRTDTAAVDLPDSLTVIMAEGQPRLDRLVYFDVNDDRNQIVFGKCEYLDKCDEKALAPHFPDSAEVINIR
jgi:hypothetical protein